MLNILLFGEQSPQHTSLVNREVSWDTYGVQSFFENICVFIMVLGPPGRKGWQGKVGLGDNQALLGCPEPWKATLPRSMT